MDHLSKLSEAEIADNPSQVLSFLCILCNCDLLSAKVLIFTEHYTLWKTTWLRDRSYVPCATAKFIGFYASSVSFSSCGWLCPTSVSQHLPVMAQSWPKFCCADFRPSLLSYRCFGVNHLTRSTLIGEFEPMCCSLDPLMSSKPSVVCNQSLTSTL